MKQIIVIVALLALGANLKGCSSEEFEQSRLDWDFLGVFDDKKALMCSDLGRRNIEGAAAGLWSSKDALESMRRNGCA